MAIIKQSGFTDTLDEQVRSFKKSMERLQTD